MLQLDSRFVKRGLWPNLEKGPVLGWTITTDMEKGTIVIALLAIFSSLALAHLWHLLTFCFHQLRADGRLADGLFQQQQALLRTLPTPSSMLADTLKLWWLWRKRTDRALYRSLVLTIFGIVFSAATIGVGIFSSYVVDSSNIQVLVDSPFCGPIGFDPTTEEFYKTPLRTEKYQAKVAALGRSLAEDCYQNNTFLSERCQAFIKPNITFGRQRVDCPFDPSICVDISQPAIEFDSGILDLNNDFGMNLEKKDHVKYRKKTTCAVLKTDGRYSVINASDYPSRARARPPLPSEELLLMHFGNVPKNGGWPNTTFVHSLLTANNSVGYGTGANAFTYSSPKWSLLNDLEPLPEMSVEDVDLEVVMITKNRQTYGNPVNDPIFSAHDPFEVASNIEGENETVYFSDFPNSIVGCTLQYEFCFSRTNAPEFCTGLSGLPGNVTPQEFPEASEVQLAAIQVLVILSALFNTVLAASNGLVAQNLVRGSGHISSLPDDQWVKEMAAWESWVWASLQTSVTDYSIGPGVRESSVAPFVKNQTTEGERQLCQVQRMRNPGGFVNINVFGLTFIVLLALLVAILDMMLLRFLIFLSRFKRAMGPRIDRWIQDGVFQLQRRAYEAQGEGKWHDADREIPVTREKELLRDLPLESWPRSREEADEKGSTLLVKLRAIKSWESDASTIGKLANKHADGGKRGHVRRKSWRETE